MEAGILSKSLTGLLFASTLVYLVFLRAWRIRRLWERRVSSVDGLFLTALAMGLAAIYAESPFQNLSVLLIEYTGLPETVLQIDMQIEFIKQLPQEVWNDLVMRFGWDEPAPLPAPPTEPFGWVSAALLPAVAVAVEVMLRTLVYWSSFLLIAVCFALRLAVGVTRGVRNWSSSRSEDEMDEQLAKLQEKVAILERRLQPLSSSSPVQ